MREEIRHSGVGAVPAFVGAVLACSLVVLLGSPSTALAYTTRHTSSGKTVRWATDQVALHISSDFLSHAGSAQGNSALQMATDVWRLPNVPEVNPGGAASQPEGYQAGQFTENAVYWLERWPFHDSRLAVTVSTFQDDGTLLDADVLVNGTMHFTLMEGSNHGGLATRGAASQFDLGAVLTHEMGHFLGLGENAANDHATMWPDVAAGDTHQRELTDDDEQGVTSIYSGTVLKPAAGCGGATIARSQSSSATWLLLGVVVSLAALGWVWRTVNRHNVQLHCASGGVKVATAGSGFMLAFGAVTLFIVPQVSHEGGASSSERLRVAQTFALQRRMKDPAVGRELAEAAADASSTVRLAAAVAISGDGMREDRELAGRLANDDDPVVREMGAKAFAHALTAAPRMRIASTTDAAKLRLAEILPASGSVRDLVTASAHKVGIVQENGLFFTQYTVKNAAGEESELRVPGGTQHGVTQLVGDDFVPEDGASIVIAKRDDGELGWARYQDGVAYGGMLGDGPAIEIGSH